MTDLYFVGANGNMFVVPDAPDGYARDDAAQIAPPPSTKHRWSNGQWQLPSEPVPSADPADYPLLPWQFFVMVDVLGKHDLILAAIAQIDDVWAQAIARRRYLQASSYEYGDPLLQQMRSAVGMSEEELASAWMLAKDLRSSE